MNGNKKTPILGNPEFELSTDTDEESLGEPDSSNVNGLHAQTPYEFAKHHLKNNPSLEDREKVLNLVKYMEKEITQLKEHHKKEMREVQQQQQQRNEGFRKTIENLQNQFNQQNNRNINSSVIATSCLSSSSSSSSSSLSSSSSYDFDRSERRNSIVEKPNVIIKPLKKSLRITPLLDDCKPTANITSLASTMPSIVIMPKSEDIMNNNNTKIYNNNNNSIVNGQTESLDDTLKKTIKAEKL